MEEYKYISGLKRPHFLSPSKLKNSTLKKKSVTKQPQHFTITPLKEQNVKKNIVHSNITSSQIRKLKSQGYMECIDEIIDYEQKKKTNIKKRTLSILLTLGFVIIIIIVIIVIDIIQSIHRRKKQLLEREKKRNDLRHLPYNAFINGNSSFTIPEMPFGHEQVVSKKINSNITIPSKNVHFQEFNIVKKEDNKNELSKEIRNDDNIESSSSSSSSENEEEDDEQDDDDNENNNDGDNVKISNENIIKTTNQTIISENSSPEQIQTSDTLPSFENSSPVIRIVPFSRLFSFQSNNNNSPRVEELNEELNE